MNDPDLAAKNRLRIGIGEAIGRLAREQQRPTTETDLIGSTVSVRAVISLLERTLREVDSGEGGAVETQRRGRRRSQRQIDARLFELAASGSIESLINACVDRNDDLADDLGWRVSQVVEESLSERITRAGEDPEDLMARLPGKRSLKKGVRSMPYSRQTAASPGLDFVEEVAAVRYRIRRRWGELPDPRTFDEWMREKCVKLDQMQYQPYSPDMRGFVLTEEGWRSFSIHGDKETPRILRQAYALCKRWSDILGIDESSLFTFVCTERGLYIPAYKVAEREGELPGLDRVIVEVDPRLPPQFVADLFAIKVRSMGYEPIWDIPGDLEKRWAVEDALLRYWLSKKRGTRWGSEWFRKFYPGLIEGATVESTRTMLADIRRKRREAGLGLIGAVHQARQKRARAERDLHKQILSDNLLAFVLDALSSSEVEPEKFSVQDWEYEWQKSRFHTDHPTLEGDFESRVISALEERMVDWKIESGLANRIHRLFGKQLSTGKLMNSLSTGRSDSVD